MELQNGTEDLNLGQSDQDNDQVVNMITTIKGMEVTGKSEAQVRRYLKVLTDCGVVKSKKTTKGNVYTRL